MDNEERQYQLFGMTFDQVIAEKPKHTDAGMWAMSILSDVQELIARRPDAAALERARQWINKAKYWIDVQRPSPRE